MKVLSINFCSTPRLKIKDFSYLLLRAEEKFDTIHCVLCIKNLYVLQRYSKIKLLFISILRFLLTLISLDFSIRYFDPRIQGSKFCSFVLLVSKPSKTKDEFKLRYT